MFAGPDYPDHANDTVLAIAMIETQQALDNLDEILRVPGLDGIYIGPSDLALSLGGTPKLDQTDPKMVQAIDRILAATQSRGVVAGIHCGSAAYAARMVAQGFQMVTVLSDNLLMASAAKRAVAELREEIAHGAG
jgi:4-hydroxy-2-oxoheptanedioate aldolase